MIRSLRESGILWARQMKKLVRIPLLLFFALAQPLIFLLLFSQVFSNLDRLPGFEYDSYLQFLVPSIVALTALNSAFQSGIGMVTDIEDGMLDKFLIAPIRRSSILLGKLLADASRAMAQGAVIVLVSLAMGARFATGVAGVAVMVVLAALFGVAWAGLSNIIALRTRNGELTMIVGILITFPVLFLSTAFMPSILLPDWLDAVATFNPITYIVEALRALVNTGWDWGAIGEALAVTGGLAVVTFTGATLAFRKAIT
ncbi:MAG TPA: ABC transporter permease [Acidimicrobiia bacterium]|nr:ABC transporter permease [Acidimicrobiia bacterium]